jgi:hypothetical protein
MFTPAVTTLPTFFRETDDPAYVATALTIPVDRNPTATVPGAAFPGIFSTTLLPHVTSWIRYSSSLCLRSSDWCFVCHLSLHRHSTRGSFCVCPLLFPLTLLFPLLLFLLLIRETSTSLNIRKTERSSLPLDIVFSRTIFPQV